MTGCGLVSARSGQVKMAGCCTNGGEHSDFTKCGEFVDSYRNCWLLQKDLLYGLSQSASQPVSHLRFTTAAFVVSGRHYDCHYSCHCYNAVYVVCLNPATSVRPSSLRLSNESGCLPIDRLQSLFSLLLHGHRVLLCRG